MHFYGAMTDEEAMCLAFDQALKVKGKTLPNPPVGAVLVLSGEIIGEGGTQRAGQDHAEIQALKQAGPRAKGSILYVTLEPCCHQGRTPPCTEAIIAAGISRVVVSHRDPNPKVAGKGLARLRQAGLQVDEGLWAGYGEEFYRHFAFYIQKGRPRIILKIAQTLDGRINPSPATQGAITGPESQKRNHALRVAADAWLIGAATLRIDNPRLTPRLVRGPSPDVWVLSRGKKPLPRSSLLFSPGRKGKVILASPEFPSGLPHQVEHQPLSRRTVQSKLGSAHALMTAFEQRGYHLVVVEGGAEMWSLFLAAGIWDEIWLFTAPRFYPRGKPWTAKLPAGWDKSLRFGSFTPLGDDSLTVFYRKSSAS